VQKNLIYLVITDPPFGNNLFYADLADFFYVWLRIPLQKWYAGLTEFNYFKSERTPHSMEAIDNPAEHPDDRELYEKLAFVENKHLPKIRELSGDDLLEVNDSNPFYRTKPSSEFYSQTLSACWAESYRLLKNGGIMAFTFHHNEDQAWLDILKALFDAGYVLVATYPIRSDETKGEKAQFGSQKIEYDVIHVCRKRLNKIEPVSWAKMRRWVKSEATRLKDLLEHAHGKDLPESDLRVILRGKSLEFYSRHYGQVFTGDRQPLGVRDALLGINSLTISWKTPVRPEVSDRPTAPTPRAVSSCGSSPAAWKSPVTNSTKPSAEPEFHKETWNTAAGFEWSAKRRMLFRSTNVFPTSPKKAGPAK